MNRKKTGGSSIEGMIGGLTDLIEKLGDLAEKGEKLSKTKEFEWGSGGKERKGVFGFSIKTVLGGDEVEVEPFGNLHRDEKSGEAVVEEVREPVVDVFEEEDHTLVVAEMPGVAAEDVHLDAKDDVLTIRAERGSMKYGKEVLLPQCYPRDKMEVSCNNGILEIRCRM
jgi:HSP20 family protein